MLTGWGRTTQAAAEIEAVSSVEDIQRVISRGRPLLTRGLGRSYGDAGLLSGGVVLDLRGVNDISPVSAEGIVTVGGGVSIDELLREVMPHGWFVPVTPGTRQVTMGGALAADVHGKNHHLDGSFGTHVLAFELVTAAGLTRVTPESDAALFWATVGGMGLTGVITSVTLRLLPIVSDQVLVDTTRHATLASVMDAMLTGDASYRYSVAWVDCMTRGRHMGRGILTRGDHDTTPRPIAPPTAPRLTVPFAAPSGLLNPLSIRVFNEAWFRYAPRQREAEPQSLSSFFHPLDGVSQWNLLYGRRGFVQYQFCVPDAAAATIEDSISLLSSSKVPSFLAVLKRFGPSNPSPLSFPMPGWTLALDLPVGPVALPRVLDQLDELVLGAGGRVYFAKDARMNPRDVRAMYPRLDDFLAVKSRVDPHHQFVSDLSRRLEIGPS